MKALLNTVIAERKKAEKEAEGWPSGEKYYKVMQRRKDWREFEKLVRRHIRSQRTLCETQGSRNSSVTDTLREGED